MSIENKLIKFDKQRLSSLSQFFVQNGTRLMDFGEGPEEVAIRVESPFWVGAKAENIDGWLDHMPQITLPIKDRDLSPEGICTALELSLNAYFDKRHPNSIRSMVISDALGKLHDLIPEMVETMVMDDPHYSEKARDFFKQAVSEASK